MGLAVACTSSAGCTAGPVRIPIFDTGPYLDGGPMDANTDAPAPADVGPDMGRDAPLSDGGLSPDAACESRTSPATLTRLPADIIWVIDNSGSMAPAITAIQSGINGFATQLVGSDLDYRIIVLSLRTARSGRFPVCFPEPLAGPGCADNAPNFYQVEVDIKSTKPIEQILGTLAQSAGYTMGTADGGGPWRDLLRPGATRTFVLVSDDNARTCALGPGACAAGDPVITETSLEDFPGGGDPFNSSTLGPGILDPSYMGLFDGYTFDAIYGYGSETDPTARCVPPSGASATFPASSGPTYTALVERTHGVRAPICDPAADFPMFFDAIAASVVRGSPIECTVDIPPPPAGMTFQAGRVNVVIRGASSSVVGYVHDVSACDATRGGWYYDDLASPTQIILCPTSCTDARATVVGPTDGLDVQFGCQSILI